MSPQNPIAIQFDESSDACRLYGCYKKAKEINPTFREHLGAIAFVDDKKHPPVQAADMLGNLALKAWRRGLGGLEAPPAFDDLVIQTEGIRNCDFLIYREPELKALAAHRMAVHSRIAELP